MVHRRTCPKGYSAVYCGVVHFGKTVLFSLQTVRDLGIPSAILHPSEPTKAPLFKSKEELNNYLKNKPTLIFLKEFTSVNTAKDLIQQLNQLQGVKSVKFISSEEAAQNYREINKNNPTLLELMPPVFPALIEVYIDPNLPDDNYKQLSERVEKSTKSYPFVTSVLTQVDNLP